LFSDILVTDGDPDAIPEVRGAIVIGATIADSFVDTFAAQSLPIARVAADTVSGHVVRMYVRNDIDFGCFARVAEADTVDDALATALYARVGQPGTFPRLLLPPEHTLCPSRGEGGEPLGLHRIRSQWQLHVTPRLLDASGLAQPLVDSADVSAASGDVTLGGFGDGDVFTFDGDSASIAFAQLDEVAAASDPFLPIDLASPFLSVTRAAPVPTVDFGPTLGTTSVDDAFLSACPGTALVGDERAWDGLNTSGGATATVRVLVGAFPPGISAGFTSQLVAWDSDLVVAGLTTADIAVSAPFAREYIPGHHNFSQSLIVDFDAEPAIDAATRAELDVNEVHAAVFMDHDGGLILLDAEGTPRIAP
jgi:hypothetical protein